MKRFLALTVLILAGVAAHGQTACTRTASVNITASGVSQVLAAPPDTSTAWRVCGFKIQVTQGATPANYTLQTCTSTACTGNVFPLSPVMQGHASTTDNYNLDGSALIQLNIQRGQGLFLNLSSAPTMATVQVFYSGS
jgi:hypothetical protein